MVRLPGLICIPSKTWLRIALDTRSSETITFMPCNEKAAQPAADITTTRELIRPIHSLPRYTTLGPATAVPVGGSGSGWYSSVMPAPAVGNE